MHPDEELAAIFARIGHLPPEEQKEHLLAYFSIILSEMPVSNILALRAHFLATRPDEPERDLFVEVLDGHLELRRLRES